MTENCCAAKGKAGGDVMLLACSGASNVGQLANAAAVELTREGFGKMFCLAGIGGRLSGFVQSAKDTPNVVVMDGCSIGCGKAIFEQAGLPLRGYMDLTELGIEKNKDFNLKREDVEKVKSVVKEMCATQGMTATVSERVAGCCSC